MESASERPDLDVRFSDGNYIGVEVAAASETAQRKHDAAINLIEVLVRDLVEGDSAFRKAFGGTYLTLTLNGAGPGSPLRIASKREAQSIATEIELFVRSKAHLSPTADYFTTFSPRYETPAITLSPRSTTVNVNSSPITTARRL